MNMIVCYYLTILIKLIRLSIINSVLIRKVIFTVFIIKNIKILKELLFNKIITPLKLIAMPKINPKHAKRVSTYSSDASESDTKSRKTKGLGRICSVKGCKNLSIHSLSLVQYQPSIGAAKLELKPLKGTRKLNICKNHYKSIKKYKKKDDKILKPNKFQGGTKKFKREKLQARLE